MRRYLYLSTAVAGVMMTTGGAWAQCVTTQDCAALGYTDSACPGSGVKCPWQAKPAMENTPPVLAHHLILGTEAPAPAQVLINILVQGQDTPVVQVPPAAANIPPAPAPAAMNGKTVLVSNKFSTELKVICIIAMAKLLVYVLRVWASMSR